MFQIKPHLEQVFRLPRCKLTHIHYTHRFLVSIIFPLGLKILLFGNPCMTLSTVQTVSFVYCQFQVQLDLKHFDWFLGYFVSRATGRNLKKLLQYEPVITLLAVQTVYYMKISMFSFCHFEFIFRGIPTQMQFLTASLQRICIR